MNQQIPGPNMGSSILAEVREGMPVYDREGDEIGTVESVYLGEISQDAAERGEGPAEPSPPPRPGEGTLLDAIADVFDTDDVPEVLRDRLLRSGFARIDAKGLFASDRYVVPDQIASVSLGRVNLSVSREELIKR